LNSRLQERSCGRFESKEKKQALQSFLHCRACLLFAVWPDNEVRHSPYATWTGSTDPDKQTKHTPPFVHPFLAKDFFHHSQEVIDWTPGFL